MTDPTRAAILASLVDAEEKAWDALAGYKFWMFGYHAARWVNYNMLLPRSARFRSPFKGLVEHAASICDKRQLQLPTLEINAGADSLLLLESEGDGA